MHRIDEWISKALESSLNCTMYFGHDSHATATTTFEPAPHELTHVPLERAAARHTECNTWRDAHSQMDPRMNLIKYLDFV